jgi:hypothetical protein
MLFKHSIKLLPLAVLTVALTLAGGCSSQTQLGAAPSLIQRTHSVQTANNSWQDVHWGDEFTPN